MQNNAENFAPKRKKKRKKRAFRSGLIFFLIFVLIALIAAVAVVSIVKPDNKSVQVTVSVTDDKGNMMMSRHVTVVAPKPTALMAFEKAFSEQQLSYNYDSSGIFTQIGGLSVSGSSGWIYYVNGSWAPVGVSEYEIAENDILEFRFESFSASEPEPTPATPDENTVPVKVIITGAEDDKLESSVILDKDDATAEAAFKSVCDKNKIEYTISGGKILSCAMDTADDANEWVVYVNDTADDSKLSEIELKSADTVEFSYEEVE